jgi:hypothetical protein
LFAELPAVVSAADTPEAILRISGEGVSVNEKPAANSAALFLDDLIQTGQKAAARIESTSSSVDINPDTIVQFVGDELVLDHGVLAVNTSVGLKVRVDCLVVTPVNSADWTRYDVSDVDGELLVSALKSDVYISERSRNPKDVKDSDRYGRAIVHEGEQKSRQDKCGAAMNPPTVTPGVGAILNSPIARIIGGAGIGVLTCWALCRSDDPISPHTP